ncbi:MAG TPA: DUF3489 domain-containing protein [Patescibacteria group bacterium]|nr:DUF3489 domain-containing protein [Patescibacteria group bacterium]
MPKLKSLSPKTALSAKAKGNSDTAKPKTAASVRQGTKISLVIKLLSRAQGATIEGIATATGWQQHTIRSVLSRALRKNHGYKIISTMPKDGRKRLYWIENNKMEPS